MRVSFSSISEETSEEERVKSLLFHLFFLTYRRAIMNKTKLIIHERFNGKQTLEDVFLSAFQSESYQLLQHNSSVIMNSTEQSQDSFSSGRELKNGTNE